MTPAPTLLPCPFCGGRASRRWYGGRLLFFCSRDITCGVSGPWCGSDTDSQPDIEAEAVRMWNSVAATLRTPAPAATREMLVEVARLAIHRYTGGNIRPGYVIDCCEEVTDRYLAAHPLAAPPQSAIDAAVAREREEWESAIKSEAERHRLNDDMSRRDAVLWILRARSAAKGEQ